MDRNKVWFPLHPIAVAVFALTGPVTTLAQESAPAQQPAPTQQSAPAEQPAPAKKAAPDPISLETVTITANKRPERQREVAGTISVVGGADMEQRGSRDQEDVFKLTPGVEVSKGDPSRNAITIRGLGTAGCSICGGFQQGTTGFYLEDVPITDPFGSFLVLDLAPFDLDHIEVLRGPQGALYGSSSLGGAVRYLVNKANLKNREASVLVNGSQVSGGGLGYSLYGMVNTPLSDSAAVRVVAFDRKDAGYIDNIGTGRKDANELRQQGGRITGTLKATRDLSLTATLLTQTTAHDDAFGVSPDPNRLEQNTPTASPGKSKLDFGSLQADYDLGAAQLTSITGYYRKFAHGEYDSTRIYGNIGASFGLPALPAVTSPTDNWSHALSQELRIASKEGSRLSWVAGMFYQRTSYTQTSTFLAPGGEQLWGALGPTLLPNDVLLKSFVGAETSEKALFADGEYAFGNGWSAGLGGRFYRTSLVYNTNLLLFGTEQSSNPNSNDQGLTPKATLKYKFGDNMWYALASRGYRFGGANSSPPFKPYKSDKLWNYETGLRLAPTKDLTLDAAVFLMDWSNAQVNSYDMSGTVPYPIIANIGKARNKGVEFSADWRATRAFRINAAVAYTDARTAAPFPSGSIPGSIIPSGSRLPSTPNWQTAITGAYMFEGPLETQGRAYVTHTFLGSRVMDIDGLTHVPGYSTVDAGLSFVHDAWTFGVNVANIFDKRGVTGIIGGTPAIPYTDYYIQRPRTVTVSLRWDYY